MPAMAAARASDPVASVSRLRDEERQSRQHEHAHDVVVIGRAGKAEVSPPVMQSSVMMPAASRFSSHAQHRARHQIKRNDVRVPAPRPARPAPPTNGYASPADRTECRETDCNRSPDAPPRRRSPCASVQEGVRHVPMIIAEIPRHVLAEGNHEQPPSRERSGRGTAIPEAPRMRGCVACAGMRTGETDGAGNLSFLPACARARRWLRAGARAAALSPG